MVNHNRLEVFDFFNKDSSNCSLKSSIYIAMITISALFVLLGLFQCLIIPLFTILLNHRVG